MMIEETKALLGNFLITAGKKIQATRLPCYRIIVNAAKCLSCGDIIESVDRHNFVKCRCGKLAVDGGKDYIKRSAEDITNFVEMTVYEEVK